MKTPLETIAEAVFQLACSINSEATPLNFMSRRWRPWDNLGDAGMPCLFQRQRNIEEDQAGKFGETRYRIHLEIWLYIAWDQNDLINPSSKILNAYYMAIDNAFKPSLTNGVGGRNQLVGYPFTEDTNPVPLVENCWIDGVVALDEANITPPAILMFPITVITG